jgi:ribosome-binding protein aMBF1 (putative translation factor)
MGNYASNGLGPVRPANTQEFENLITARQIRAARALLAWSQQDLADRADLSRRVVNRIEGEVADSFATSLRKIETALVEAGITLLPANSDEGEGVRLAKPD